ncbi:MAG: hypothetical protein A3F17_09080 [Gammaproteobacteria bacterium RIFCSPHIGHO2_12_FULL_41_15]|nr:MAG: hypothetical protein A3F17_09080 [Gammaproteobacteria bacterium RIFCSPHIGHO2_12_FULL_41_15]
MTDINLLPWREEARKKNQRRWRITVFSYAVVVLLIAFFIHMSFSSQVSRQLKENKMLQNETVTLNAEITRLKNASDIRNALAKRIALLQELEYNRFLAVKLFNELTPLVPQGIYFSKMERSKNTVTLSGEASSNEMIAELLKRIDGSIDLKNPSLNEVTVQRSPSTTAIKFQLVFQLTSPYQQEIIEKNGKKKR